MTKCKNKRILILGWCLLIIGSVLGVVLHADDVSAVAYVKCNSNESTQRACNLSGTRGAMWLNTKKGNKSDESAGDDIVVKRTSAKGTITLYLHGAVHGGSGSAQCIHLTSKAISGKACKKGSEPEDDSSIKHIYGHKLQRNEFPGSLNSSSLKVTLKMSEVKKWKHTQTKKYDIYKKTLHAYRCFSYRRTAGACYSDPMPVTIKVERDDEPEPEDEEPEVSLTGITYIGETAPTPTFSYPTVTAESSSEQRVFTKSKEIKFYVNADHTGSGLGAKSGYTGDDVATWACAQFGAAECNTTEKIPNETKYAGYKFCAAGAIRVGISTKIYVYDEDGNVVGWYWGPIVWRPWKVSAASCIPIAKKTNVGIAGNDTYVNNGVKTAVSRKWSGMAYGSWSEFLIATGAEGIFGNTTDIGTSSGSGLYNGLSSSVQQSDTTKWSSESTGNQDISGQDVPAAEISTSSSDSFLKQVEKIVENGNTDAVEIRKVDSISTNITNSDVKKQIIVYSDGDINIADSVTQIDAWVIAPNGTVDTCAGYRTTADGAARNSGEEITTDKCNKQLQINGLVYASAIKLDRTYGGETNELSEIINLTPASFIWAYSQATSTYANPTTVYTRELAPRM